jgi:hypothetical protein
LDAKRFDAEGLMSLRNTVQRLGNGVKTSELGQEALNQLRDLFDLSDRSLEIINQNRILKSLSFPMMHERFGDVADACRNTFQWMFEDEERIFSTHEQLRISFKTWLSYGKEVFHICGKPGSGKSTLMKFLCQDPQTMSELTNWAGGKKLIFAKYFFWHPGDSMQKNFKGLVRGLLYNILSQSTELVASAFPQYWQSDVSVLLSGRLDLQVEHHVVLKALEKLMTSGSTYSKHRFCFFLDGLDEFEGDPRQIVEKLGEWMAAAPDDVKICVSSRDWPIFETFPADQRLYLHRLTEDDIKRAVRERLETHTQFLYMQKESPEACKDLVTEISEKAEGVFLWVTLAIKAILGGLDINEPISKLRQMIERFPPELTDFLARILKMVDESPYRTEAYRTFLVATTLSSGHSGRNMSLLMCSFLHASERDAQLHDASKKELKDRLNNARKQLNWYCKGLLESQPDLHGEQELWPIRDRVKFVHRSIYEFLTRPLVQSTISEYLQHRSAAELVREPLLSEMQSLSLRQMGVFGVFEVQTFFHLLRDTDIEPHYEFMDCLEEVLRERQRDLIPDLSATDWSGIQFFVSRGTWLISDEKTRSYISLTHLALFFGFDEYVIRKIDRDPNLISNGAGAALLVTSLIALSNVECPWEKTHLVIKALFKRGVSPNSKTPWIISDIPQLSAWKAFVIFRSRAQIMREDVWTMSETFLQFGADPNFRFRVHGVRETSLEGKPSYRVGFPSPMSWKPTHILIDVFNLQGGCGERFMEFVENRGDVLSFRDAVDFFQPKNSDTLRVLIDQNIQLQRAKEGSDLHGPQQSPGPVKKSDISGDFTRTSSNPDESQEAHSKESPVIDLMRSWRRLAVIWRWPTASFILGRHTNYSNIPLLWQRMG